jgi:hypothetical protein
MKSRFASIALVALSTALMAAEGESAKPVSVKPELTWEGSANSEAAGEKMPKVVTDKEKLTEVWIACERTNKLPEIDFSKKVVIVVTSSGSRINVGAARLSDSGDLKVVAIATRDFRPGFRYVIAVFPREGVKSVNGAELRK